MTEQQAGEAEGTEGDGQGPQVVIIGPDGQPMGSVPASVINAALSELAAE